MMMNEDNKMEEKTKRRFQIFNLRFDDIGCPKISFWVKIFPSYTKARTGDRAQIFCCFLSSSFFLLLLLKVLIVRIKMH